MRFKGVPHGVPPIDGASWVRVEGVRVEGVELPYPVLIRLAIGEDGRLIATGLLMQAEGELTARATRIPLADIVSKVAAMKPAANKRVLAQMYGIPGLEKDPRWREHVPELQNAPEGVEGWPTSLAADIIDSSTRRRVAKRVRVRPGRRGYSDQHYEDFLRAYARAKRERPRAPIQKVMEDLDISEATAHRWRRAAEKRELAKKSGKED